jgi:hypothetical protein
MPINHPVDIIGAAGPQRCDFHARGHLTRYIIVNITCPQ